MKNNFFNIIVPTRNRLGTLRHALGTVLRQNYDNYQIIVSDNFSTDGTKKYIESLNSEKIRYFNTGKSLSMSSNYEFAISKISDGFVVLIGDDDGLLPTALTDINDIVNRENALAIASNQIIYYWPGGSPYENLLMIPNAATTVKLRKSSIFLEGVLKGDLHYAELPMLYTGGVVHSSLIEKAKKNGNKFYNSFTPDVYSGIAIATVAREYLKVERSFAISGLSKYSNGQSQLGSSGDASIAKTFFAENDIPFFPSLGDGQTKSLQLLTLEAYLQCGFLRESERIDLNKHFETVIAKAPKNLRCEIRCYLRINCKFNPKVLSKSQLRINLLTLRFVVLDFIQRARRVVSWDIIYVENTVRNVYEAAEFIDKTNRKAFMKLLYKFNLLRAYLKLS